MNITEAIEFVQALAIHHERDKLKEVAEILAAYRDGMQWRGEQLDLLLVHCGDAECDFCAETICPFGETLHFHHDGCPACALAPDDHSACRKNRYLKYVDPELDTVKTEWLE